MHCQSHLYRGCGSEQLARRWFLKECGLGLGAMALQTLLRDYAVAAPATPNLANALAPK